MGVGLASPREESAASGGVGLGAASGPWRCPPRERRKRPRLASVIVCLLMSGLYLHLSKGNDSVERAVEASGRGINDASGRRFGEAFQNPSTLVAMRRALLSRTFPPLSALTRLAALVLVFTCRL